jgi:hypothetical protein
MHNLPIVGVYSLFFEQEDNQYYIGKSTDIAAGNTHKYLKDSYPELYKDMLAKRQ